MGDIKWHSWWGTSLSPLSPLSVHSSNLHKIHSPLYIKMQIWDSHVNSKVLRFINFNYRAMSARAAKKNGKVTFIESRFKLILSQYSVILARPSFNSIIYCHDPIEVQDLCSSIIVLLLHLHYIVPWFWWSNVSLAWQFSCRELIKIHCSSCTREC